MSLRFENCVFIPIYGAAAAAATTAISYIFSLIILRIYIDKNIKIKNKLGKLLSPCVGCLCIFAFCGMMNLITDLHIRMLCKVLAGGIAYCAVQIIMRNEQFASLMHSCMSVLKGVKRK